MFSTICNKLFRNNVFFRKLFDCLFIPCYELTLLKHLFYLSSRLIIIRFAATYSYLVGSESRKVFFLIGIGSWSWCSWRRTYKVSKFILLYSNFSYKTEITHTNFPHFLVSARTLSISRCICIQTFCVHKRNVLRYLRHGTYLVVLSGGSHFCQSLKGRGSGGFWIKRKGGPTLFSKKIPKFSTLPPPLPRQEKTHLPLYTKIYLVCHNINWKWLI